MFIHTIHIVIIYNRKSKKTLNSCMNLYSDFFLILALDLLFIMHLVPYYNNTICRLMIKCKPRFSNYANSLVLMIIQNIVRLYIIILIEHVPKYLCNTW